MSFKKPRGSDAEKCLSPEAQQAKIAEVKKIIGPYALKLPALCSDDSILRYLKARNWSAKKAARMLKQTVKWRIEYKPEKIKWEDIASEAETGKIYRASYRDKYGRIVLVMRPGYQNTNNIKGQIKYLVYCVENAIMNLGPDQGQMVWITDFQRWNMSSISMNVTRETANILQNHYPERLGLAILYNPPKIFESFWAMVKPFIEPKTHNKVRFVYAQDPRSREIMEDLFDMDKLESSFGGRNSVGFDYETYAKMMRDDDMKLYDSISCRCPSPTYPPSIGSESVQSECIVSEICSQASEEEDILSNGETLESAVPVDNLEDTHLDKKDAAVAKEEESKLDRGD